ncbi:hypothetical protein FSP39_000766 [Pinctada imbricata]|uniref:Glycosyl hydrolase family 13 catalytic domain-containing protein n=1 Tax=Pinctada imbricata TaxID=66713 RepID=A0AA88XT00_PINIB|nr:hypothetical protein FSP39_000766 [Pinctada imbricata]
MEGLVSSVCILCFTLYLTQLVDSRTADEWKSRIIYQILTDRFAPEAPIPSSNCTDLRSYCGGKFKGIKENLDYIQSLGANAIWISPIVENTPLGYHGYWAKDIYRVNPEFGTEEDLVDLIRAVANHMGYNHGCFWSHECTKDQLTNFTGFSPFNQTEHYHTLCEITDWKNQNEVELCRLAKLPDLNQSNEYVRDTLKSWIKWLGDKYEFDGYRIDTAVEVDKPFWSEFQSSAGRFCMGEANNGDDVSYLASYQGPLNSVLNFPLFHAIVDVFCKNKSMSVLIDSLQEQRSHFSDVTILGIFVDNHDFPRFLSLTPSQTLLKNALAYVLLTEGIPIIYYGTEQSFHGVYDPYNRESLWPYYDTDNTMFKFITTVSRWKLTSDTDFGGKNQEEIYSDDHTLVFVRGKTHEVIVAVSNLGRTVSIRFSPPYMYFSPGTNFKMRLAVPIFALLAIFGCVSSQILGIGADILGLGSVGLNSLDFFNPIDDLTLGRAPFSLKKRKEGSSKGLDSSTNYNEIRKILTIISTALTIEHQIDDEPQASKSWDHVPGRSKHPLFD